MTLEVEKLGGLWKTDTEVKRNLRGLNHKECTSALYTQLQFHNVVLKSASPDSYYFQKTWTVKGRKIEFTPAEMEQHLLKIIKVNVTPAEDDVDATEVVVEPVVKQPYQVASKETVEDIVRKQKGDSEVQIK